MASKSSLPEKRITLIRNLLLTTQLGMDEIAKKAKCKYHQVVYQKQKIEKERSHPTPPQDALTVLNIENINSYLMEAIDRLAGDERNIKDTDPKKIEKRISCIDVIVRTRNSIESSRTPPTDRMIYGELDPQVAEILWDEMPEKNRASALERMTKLKEERQKKLENSGGLIQ